MRQQRMNVCVKCLSYILSDKNNIYTIHYKIKCFVKYE